MGRQESPFKLMDGYNANILHFVKNHWDGGGTHKSSMLKNGSASKQSAARCNVKPLPYWLTNIFGSFSVAQYDLPRATSFLFILSVSSTPVAERVITRSSSSAASATTNLKNASSLLCPLNPWKYTLLTCLERHSIEPACLCQ